MVCSQEKKRIMLRLKPPGHENAIIDNYVPIFRYGMVCRWYDIVGYVTSMVQYGMIEYGMISY